MKMKKACEATYLTERAVRLYISKGLITPQQKNGLLDFSPEDIQHLQDIALFRQLDFTIEQIAGMIAHEADIPAILAARKEATQSSITREDKVLTALIGLESEELSSLHTLADSIRARQVIPAPNFSQFDEIDDDTRRTEALAASQEVDRQQQRQQLWRRLGWTAFVIVAVAVLAATFLQMTRVKGYIALSPVTVVSVQGECATFHIGNEQAVEVLGRDTITVEYRADGFRYEYLDMMQIPRISAGDVAEHSCQLAVELTNYDLLRLGVNPLQDLNPRSVQRHNAWMSLILHAMFEDGESDNAILWLRYPVSATPLLWVEE